jgi:glycosyltransferase involved in cell wall biosynthesis
MKILLLATIYEIGGLSNVIRNLLDNLDKKKFEAVFLVETLASKRYPLREGIRFINLDIKPAKGCIGKLNNIFRHLCTLRKTIVTEAPDVVLGFGYAVNCLYLLSFLWPLRKMPKTVLGEYTEQLFVKTGERSLKDHILSFFYKAAMFLLYFRADAIVSVSESLARHIRRFFLVDTRKIKVIHVPVNTEEIRLLSQENIQGHEHRNGVMRVGTISRLSFEKGVNYLIEAFSFLAKSMDVSLVIIGDGKERNRLEQMARGFKIEDRVSFLGWQDNPYKYLKAMDVFVLPSLWEGFPTVIVESMVCGIPVVATSCVGGVRELVEDGVDGLLAPPKNSKALSESIHSLLKDSHLRERLTKVAAKKVIEFDSPNITRQYESLISSL